MTMVVRPSMSDPRHFCTRRFALWISRVRSGFVEIDRGILVDGTGDREALALATGELAPAVTDIGIIACGHLLDELIGVRDLGSLTHLLEVAPSTPKAMFSKTEALKRMGS